MAAEIVVRSTSASEPIAARVKVPRAEASPTLEQVGNAIADGLVVLSAEWTLVYVNAAAQEVLGRPADEMLGRNHWEVLPQLAGTELERVYRRAASTGERGGCDYCFPTSSRWYHVQACPSGLGLTVTFHDITERRANEAKHILAQERFQVAAATPWLTLYEQDVELRYTWLYPPEPEHTYALGRSDVDLCTGGSLGPAVQKKLQVMASGMPARIEVPIKTGHGTSYYDTLILPRRDAAGRTIGVTGAALDITDRKNAEAALRESESRVRAAYEHAPVGIAESDTQGRLLSINEMYAAQLGYTPGELLGRPFAELVHPEDRAACLADLATLLGGAGVETRELRYVHKLGRTVWLAVTRSVVRDAAGVPKFGLAIAEDITERKRATLQQQLQYRLVASVNRAATPTEVYEAALDALCQSQGCTRGAILLGDTAGMMRFVAWRGVSDEYRAAVAGHSPWLPGETDPQPVAIPDVAESTLEPDLREAFAREGIRALAFFPLTYERRLFGKFMVYFDNPHEFRAEELQTAETIARQVGVAIERQRAAEGLEALVRERTVSLRDAIQQMEEFSYTVSHDLRAPIRGMLTYANVILDDHGPTLTAEVREYLNRILKNANRMDALVRDTLAYARVARGELAMAPLSLDECVRLAIVHSPAAGAVSIEGHLGTAVGSEPLMMQVFGNLLGNAVKFVRKGTLPRVRVSAERNGGRVRVRVQDNGIGIPPHQQLRVFGIFERLHPGSEYEGTGIGLAIVRKAVERMGGEVGIMSDGVNGTTFWIELPAPPPGETAGAPTWD